MLTVRQKQIKDYLGKTISKNGVAPSEREIAQRFHISPSTAHEHIAGLQNKGYVEKYPGRARGIKIIAAPKRAATKPKVFPANKIFLKDTVEGIRKYIPDESCDVIIADPPYNIGKDFGNNQDKLELADYIEWSKEWIGECIRALKPTGTIFIYGFSEILAHLSAVLPLEKRWLIWHYTNKNVASLNFWQRSHEAIICAWKNNPLFNRDDVREPYTEGFLNGSAGKIRKNTPGRFSKGIKTTVYRAHAGGALPRDVLKVPALAGGAGLTERWFFCHTCDAVFLPKAAKQHENHEIMKHPTQKPLGLARRLLRSALPRENPTVLIPFIGSGSECLVAKELGASYAGFEINPDYVKLAEGILAQTKFEQSLDL